MPPVRVRGHNVNRPQDAPLPPRRHPPPREAQAAARRRSAVGDSPHRHADAVARRVARLQRGDALRHGEERQQHIALALPHRPRHRARRRLAATDADRRRQGQRSQVVARRQVDRIHRQAQGRRGAAALPDRARWRRGAAAHAASDGLRRAEMVRRQQAHRLHLVGVAGPRDGCVAGEAPEGAQGHEGQGACDRAPRIPFLGSLAHRWPRAARSRLRRRHREMSRCARPRARRAAAVGALRRRLRHRARRPRDRDHRRSRRRAADDEPDRHRHRRPWPPAGRAC